MSAALDPELERRAREWAEGDPDPETRAELVELVERGAAAELVERLARELDFGTAGLRGAVGAGPSRMNVAVVVRAARAVAEHLLARVPDARTLSIVIGYDARTDSRRFAEAAAGVVLAAGISVRWFDAPAPTPLVAYAARVLGAAAALVVTASHNPREDNGLKVYGPDATQLVAPADADVARRRDALPAAAAIPRLELADGRAGPGGAALSPVPDALFERYLAELDAALPARSPGRALCIAYTPLHGLGLAPVRQALARAGFADLCVVAEQAAPDGAFPTAPFPNPELPGVLDRVLELGREIEADLVLANDPDVDRLAAGAPRLGGAPIALTGNEVGALLADFVLEHAPRSPAPLLVTSVVSSPLVLAIGRARGARVERTLTGFKWIWAAARGLEAAEGVSFAFGCEEALGYSIGRLVRDKDGISAAVWLAELAARLRAENQTLIDRLHALYRRHGAWGSAQKSVAYPGSHGMRAMLEKLERLSQTPPDRVLELPVTALVDYRRGAAERPPWLGAAPLFELQLGAANRVLVRPSGTEPKLKIYADALEPVPHAAAPGVLAERARARARALADALAEILA